MINKYYKLSIKFYRKILRIIMKGTGLKEELIGIIRLKSRPQPQPKFTFFSLQVKKKIHY